VEWGLRAQLRRFSYSSWASSFVVPLSKDFGECGSLKILGGNKSEGIDEGCCVWGARERIRSFDLSTDSFRESWGRGVLLHQMVFDVTERRTSRKFNWVVVLGYGGNP